MFNILVNTQFQVLNNRVFVRDSGYALHPWLLTHLMLIIYEKMSIRSNYGLCS